MTDTPACSATWARVTRLPTESAPSYLCIVTQMSRMRIPAHVVAPSPPSALSGASGAPPSRGCRTRPASATANSGRAAVRRRRRAAGDAAGRPGDRPVGAAGRGAGHRRPGRRRRRLGVDRGGTWPACASGWRSSARPAGGRRGHERGGRTRRAGSPAGRSSPGRTASSPLRGPGQPGHRAGVGRVAARPVPFVAVFPAPRVAVACGRDLGGHARRRDRRMQPAARAAARRRIRPPPRTVRIVPFVLIGVLGALAFASENAHQSWSAVFADEELGPVPGWAPWRPPCSPGRSRSPGSRPAASRGPRPRSCSPARPARPVRPSSPPRPPCSSRRPGWPWPQPERGAVPDPGRHRVQRDEHTAAGRRRSSRPCPIRVPPRPGLRRRLGRDLRPTGRDGGGRRPRRAAVWARAAAAAPERLRPAHPLGQFVLTVQPLGCSSVASERRSPSKSSPRGPNRRIASTSTPRPSYKASVV